MTDSRTRGLLLYMHEALYAGCGGFRGGEEGIKVYPARKALMQRLSAEGPAHERLLRVLGEAGMSQDQAEQLIVRIYNAQTMTEFAAAVEALRMECLKASGEDTFGWTLELRPRGDQTR